MTKRSKAIFAALFLLLLAGVCALLLVSPRESFNGSRVKNPEEYLLDIDRMNGTDLHTLELSEGDILQIRFETVKGSMYMEITVPDEYGVVRMEKRRNPAGYMPFRRTTN